MSQAYEVRYFFEGEIERAEATEFDHIPTWAEVKALIVKDLQAVEPFETRYKDEEWLL